MTKRILVTGSRDWDDWATVHFAITNQVPGYVEGEDAVVVVHGGARGADHIADTIAGTMGLRIEVHEANWKDLGRKAGPIRNQHMVNLGADVCLAFIKDNSRGASHCAALAEAAGIETIRFTA